MAGGGCFVGPALACPTIDPAVARPAIGTAVAQHAIDPAVARQAIGPALTSAHGPSRQNAKIPTPMLTTTMEAAAGTEENWMTTLTVNHLPLEDDLSSSNNICEDEDQDNICEDQGGDSLDSFSGFLDPGGRFAIMSESVHCPHLPGFVRSGVESCHGRIEQISPQRDSSHYRCPVPSWVHVFGKSTKTSSLRTQGASVANTTHYQKSPSLSQSACKEETEKTEFCSD